MAKVRNLSDNQQEIAFTEFDFYQQYVETFKTSELGRIKRLLPLREMAISFGLMDEKPKSLRIPRSRKPFFPPDVYGIVCPEAAGGLEWKHSLSDFLWREGKPSEPADEL